MDHFAWNGDNVWKDFIQSAPDAAQELRKVGTYRFLRRPQLQGEQSTRREVFASGTKELGRVEPVDLRGLRVGHIDQNHVEPVASRPQIVPAIRIVHVYPRVLDNRSGLRREELARHVDQRGIQLNIVDALDCGMLQRLGDTAVHSAADHQNAPRRWALQQRIVHRLFGGILVRCVGQKHAVLIDAAKIASPGHRQVAVDGVARSHQMESLP